MTKIYTNSSSISYVRKWKKYNNPIIAYLLGFINILGFILTWLTFLAVLIGLPYTLVIKLQGISPTLESVDHSRSPGLFSFILSMVVLSIWFTISFYISHLVSLVFRLISKLVKKIISRIFGEISEKRFEDKLEINRIDKHISRVTYIDGKETSHCVIMGFDMVDYVAIIHTWTDEFIYYQLAIRPRESSSSTSFINSKRFVSPNYNAVHYTIYSVRATRGYNYHKSEFLELQRHARSVSAYLGKELIDCGTKFVYTRSLWTKEV